MSAAVPPSQVFEELAMPLFDSLYNFAHWLTQNRDEAEDLVQATMTVPLDTDEGAVDLAVETTTPETILLDRSSEALVRGAMDQLPVNYREVLLLSEVEEMSYQEIAETLSIPMGTVMSRLSRARKALGEQLRSQVQGR
jgi:RNA polymerase sigma-70 factor (ECF subfamily)